MRSSMIDGDAAGNGCRAPFVGERAHGSLQLCTGKRRELGSGLDEAAPNRVAGQLDAVSHPQLLEDVGAVALHRLL